MKKKIIGIGVCMLLIIATGVTVVGTIEKNNEPQSIENNSPGLIVIWDQPPIMNETGVNICCDQIEGKKRVLANDFKCTSEGFLTEIHLFGSWKLDLHGTIEIFNLTFYSDIPESESPSGYSMPNESLWSFNATAADGDFIEEEYYISQQPETWWDPYTGNQSTDNTIYKYIITIPGTKPFLQEGTEEEPIIYWLAVHAVINIEEGGRFGLKSARPRLIDDTVMRDYEGPFKWTDLHYPPEHPYHPESIDFAFAILAKEKPPIIVVDPKWVSPFAWDIQIVNTDNITVYHYPYKISFNSTSGLVRPENATISGVIEKIEPGESMMIGTEPIFGFGSFDVTVKLPLLDPMTFKAFVLLFLIINKKWLNPT